MSDKHPTFPHDIANTSDYDSVSVLFADPMITYLFASLLETRGVDTRVLHGVEELEESAKIITEPQFFSHLSPAAQKRCLLVSNRESEDTEIICLSQPLTEDKVENALARFLER